MTFVVDASVALGWSFKDERNAYALSILHRLADEPAIAPAVWVLEVANALLIAERRGRMTSADILEVHEILATLPIDISELDLNDAIASILPVARAQELSIYDAAYLELAMRTGLPLATQDRDLRTAAGRVSVPLVD